MFAVVGVNNGLAGKAGLFSTYFRFRELAGKGFSQANLTAEPAKAVQCCFVA